MKVCVMDFQLFWEIKRYSIECPIRVWYARGPCRIANLNGSMFNALHCILIFENHLDIGDITEPRLGMHLKENLVLKQVQKCRKHLPGVGTKIDCKDRTYSWFIW